MTGSGAPPAPGPLLFARYAFPPNSLGLCGADHPRELLEYGDARASDRGLSELARTFEGAWPYLELIARANGLADPLDARVVDAYWVGNELLDRVTPDALTRHIAERFSGRLGRARELLDGVIAAGAVPHHCFHVFAVYPWLGLMRTGVIEQPLQILEQCRITPARIDSVAADGSLSVSARPLHWEQGRLLLGPTATRTVRWERGGLGFIRAPVAGDLVSIHWDFVCDRLSPRSARALLAANERAIRAVNRAGTAARLS